MKCWITAAILLIGFVARDGYAAVLDGCRADTEVVTGVEGVESRVTTLTNTSSVPVAVHWLCDSIGLEGGECEVYTQTSCWQQESRGRWQPLHTGVAVRGDGMRSCDGAAPMLALWNCAARKGRAFHLRTDAQWEMRVMRVPTGGEKFELSVEAGFDPRFLDYRLAPGESVVFPEIIAYDFYNREDLDCHKLHAYWNRRCPARSFPSIYNSWLCRFDKLDYEFVLKQVERAKEIGFDYFVIDAGWFGPAKDWGTVRGDWEERTDGYLKGRLGDVSRAVREAGMKFGFWLECESAVPSAKIAAEHPEFFVKMGKNLFLDFRNPAAFSNMLERTCALVKKYEASFLKFDFNQTARCDTSGRAFADYNAAYRRFVRTVRERNPGIYIEGCASGGYMMDLSWADVFDSFWLSDNQSAAHSFRIAKETMLRLPPRLMERWLTIGRFDGAQPDYYGKTSRLVSTDDGTWERVRSISLPFADAFTAGGPFAMSCDLTTLSADDIAHFRSVVAERRQEGAFWRSAVGRIIADTPSVTALQYSDEALSDIRLVVVPHRPQSDRCTIRPAVDLDGVYLVDGKELTGRDLAACGLEVDIGGDVPRIIRLLSKDKK